MAEKAVLAVRSDNEVFAASRALSEVDRQELMLLSTSPVKRSSVLSWTEAAWHATRQALLDMLNVAQGDGKAAARLPDLQSVTDYPAVLNVFRNNNFDIGGGTQAVFQGDVSRVNHACSPNAQGNFNTALGSFTIHAVRPIDAEEEITLSYLAEHGALRASRQSRLMDHYGFLCDCPACDAESQRGRDGEDRRLRMQARLHAYAEQAAEREHPNPEAELEVIRDMIQMHEVEGTAGRELATMYLSAAELAAKVGRKDDALRFSETGLRLDKECVGTDSPMFQESLTRVQAINAAG